MTYRQKIPRKPEAAFPTERGLLRPMVHARPPPQGPKLDHDSTVNLVDRLYHPGQLNHWYRKNGRTVPGPPSSARLSNDSLKKVVERLSQVPRRLTLPHGSSNADGSDFEGIYVGQSREELKAPQYVSKQDAHLALYWARRSEREKLHQVHQEKVASVRRSLVPEEEEFARPQAIYVTKQGDTLESIAHQYGLRPHTILKENPQYAMGQVFDADEKVKLPPPPTVAINANQYSKAQKIKKANVVHVCEQDETLHSIAHLYGINLGVILKANPSIENPKEPQNEGKKVYIPTKRGLVAYEAEEGERDTLQTIAGEYGLRRSALEAENEGIAWTQPLEKGHLVFLPPHSVPEIPESGIHIAQEGESVHSIAHLYGASQQELSRMNAQAIPNPHTRLEQGTKVKVRLGVTANFYPAEAGDTLASLCAQFVVMKSAMQKENPDIPLTQPLEAGQMIQLPPTCANQKHKKIHVADAGQSLREIAHLYNLNVATLFRANAPPVSSPDEPLSEGRRIKIPSENADYSLYRVQNGDTIASLTADFGVRADEFLRENKAVTTEVSAGQYVVLPPYVKHREAPESGVHVCHEGDTLHMLATLYNTNTNDLVMANPKVPHDVHQKIKPGTSVAIPQRRIGNAYMCEEGDTLQSIASHFGIRLAALRSENPTTPPTQELSAHTVILLPVDNSNITEEMLTPSGSTVSKATLGALGETYHITEDTETLHLIAHMFGLSLEVLVKANPTLKKGPLDPLVQGKKILIPGPPGTCVYETEAGETVAAVASQYRMQLGHVLKINAKLSPTDTLPRGTPIFIPPHVAPELEEGNIYRCEEDESVEAISHLFGVGIKELLKTNPLIKDPHKKLPKGYRVKVELGMIQVEAEEGDTLQSISIKRQRRMSQMMEENDMTSPDKVLQKGDLITIPRTSAPRLGPGRTHTCRNGESVHSVAHLYGCRADETMDLNTGIGGKHWKLVEGRKIVVAEEHLGNVYHAKNGDTMQSIAAEYGIRESHLRKENPGCILDDGCTVFLPPHTDTKLPHDGIHVSQEGETIHSIAHMYGASEYELMKLNKENEGITDVHQRLGEYEEIIVRSRFSDNVYDVEAGDTMRGVCSKLGVPFAVARTENSFLPADEPLELGMGIVLPERNPDEPDVMPTMSYDTLEGQSLLHVAHLHGKPVESLLFLNPTIEDPQRPLEPGTTIKLVGNKRRLIVHKVSKPDECIQSIAANYGVRPGHLREENDSIASLGDQDTLPIGCLVFVPPSEFPEMDIRGFHITEEGETFHSIAQLYNVPEQEVLKENKMMANSVHTRLPVGQKVFVAVKKSTRVYQAEEGDTLRGLSSQFAVRLNSLRTENPSIAKDTEPLHAGDLVMLPDDHSQSLGKDRLHNCEEGETLHSIAHLYGTTADDLLMVNPTISRANWRMKQGRKIRIPDESGIMVYETEKNGETLAAIAAQYGLRLAALMKANPAITSATEGIPKEHILFLPPHTRLENKNYMDSEESSVHIAQQDETLHSIAHLYGVMPDDLFVVNGAALGLDGVYDKVAEGSRVHICNPNVYVAQHGETIHSIANKLGMSLAALRSDNATIPPFKPLRAGHRVRLPHAWAKPMEPPTPEKTPTPAVTPQLQIDPMMQAACDKLFQQQKLKKAFWHWWHVIQGRKRVLRELMDVLDSRKRWMRMAMRVWRRRVGARVLLARNHYRRREEVYNDWLNVEAVRLYYLKVRVMNNRQAKSTIRNPRIALKIVNSMFKTKSEKGSSDGSRTNSRSPSRNNSHGGTTDNTPMQKSINDGKGGASYRADNTGHLMLPSAKPAPAIPGPD